jgi:hypothetical protein
MTVPCRIVYHTILTEVHQRALQSEQTFADLNYLLGIAVRTLDTKFRPQYLILRREWEPISFKLEGGRTNSPYWIACVGFPGACYPSLRQSLLAQTGISAILSDEGALTLYSACRATNGRLPLRRSDAIPMHGSVCSGLR